DRVGGELGHLRVDLDRDHGGPPARHQGCHRSRPRPDLPHHVVGTHLRGVEDQLVNIQINEKILPVTMLGRNPVPREQTPEIRLRLTVERHAGFLGKEPLHYLIASRSGARPPPTANNFATCLARMSVSMLTRSPGWRVPSVVTARVCGMSMIEKPSAKTSTRVRLTPSTAIEPLETMSGVQAGSMPKARNSQSPSRRRSRRTAVASTCPCTKWPPRRSPARSERSRLTGAPTGFLPRFVRTKVSGPAWTSNRSPSAETTVRQQPLTATLSPSASGPASPGQCSVNRRPEPPCSTRSTRPSASTSPVNTLSPQYGRQGSHDWALW